MHRMTAVPSTGKSVGSRHRSGGRSAGATTMLNSTKEGVDLISIAPGKIEFLNELSA